jgi:hypothetical protein
VKRVDLQEKIQITRIYLRNFNYFEKNTLKVAIILGEKCENSYKTIVEKGTLFENMNQKVLFLS